MEITRAELSLAGIEKDGNTYQVVEHSLNHPTYTVDVKAVPIPNTAATNGWNTPAPTHDPSNPPF